MREAGFALPGCGIRSLPAPVTMWTSQAGPSLSRPAIEWPVLGSIQQAMRYQCRCSGFSAPYICGMSKIDRRNSQLHLRLRPPPPTSSQARAHQGLDTEFWER